MAETTTTNLALIKPDIGGSRNSWGNRLNDDLDNLDAIFKADGNGTSVGLNIGTGKTLRLSGNMVVAEGAGIPGTALADNSITSAKIAYSTNHVITGRKSATGPGKGAEFPCSDIGFNFIAADTAAEARAVIGAAAAGGSADDPFTSVDAGPGEGPVLDVFRNSPSAADADFIGRLAFTGNNTTPAKLEYAAIQAQIVDSGPNSEDGELDFWSMLAGTPNIRFSIHGGFYARGLADKGDGTVNCKGLYVNGTAVPTDGGTSGGASGSVVGFEFDNTFASASASNDIPLDNSVPTSSEGHLFMSMNYTPKASGNRLKIDVVFVFQSVVPNIGDNNTVTAALFKDSDASALAAASAGGEGDALGTITFTYVMNAPSTSEITFKVRGGGETPARTVDFNPFFGGAKASSISVTEFKA